MKILKYLVFVLLTATILPVWAQKPESDARYQNITREYQLMPDGSQVFRYSHQLKYLTHRSFHSLFGETFVVYNPDFQKLKIGKSVTTMRDGKQVPSPENAFNEVLPHFAAHAARFNHLKEMVITHTALETGCSVDLEYSIETAAGFYPGLFDELTLAEDMPTDNYTVIVKVPAGTQLNHQMSNLRLAPEITREGDFDVYTWKVGPTKGIVNEGFMPEENEWLPTLKFSTMPSLYSAYDWFVNQPLFINRQLPPSTIKRVESVKNSEKTELDIALKLRDLVSSQTDNLDVPGQYTGFSYNTVAQVWEANAGTSVERAVLLAAMLREAGLKAEPLAVLANSRFDDNIGNPGYFDNFIVKVSTADGQEYCFTTGRYQNDARYLFPGEMLVKLEPAAESIPKKETELSSGGLKMKGQLVVDANGKSTGNFTFSMLWADNPWFKINADNQSIKNYLAGIPAKAISELKPTKVNPEQSEAYIKIDGADLFNEIAPGLYSFTIPGFSSGVSGWGMTALPSGRTAPFAFPSVHSESVVLTITIPDNFTLLTPTVTLSQKTEWGNLMLDIRQRGNIITVERGFESVARLVDKNDYETLREIVNRWNNTLYQQLIFRKK